MPRAPSMSSNVAISNPQASRARTRCTRFSPTEPPKFTSTTDGRGGFCARGVRTLRQQKVQTGCKPAVPRRSARRGKPGCPNKLNGAPEEIRTPDPQIRSLVLYPAELRARLAHRAGNGPEAGKAAGNAPLAIGFGQHWQGCPHCMRGMNPTAVTFTRGPIVLRRTFSGGDGLPGQARQ